MSKNSENQIIRVLIVDDSAYIRKVLRLMLARSPFIEVVGAAGDGLHALELADQLQPDVIVLDLMMPALDGLGFLRQQMARRPIPVVISSFVNPSEELALDALEAGAIDFIQKPTRLATEKIFEISAELIEKVKAAATVRFSRAEPPAGKVELPLPPLPALPTRLDIVVLGISTGGPQALRFMIPQLPIDLPVALAIVLHMPVGYTEFYAAKLNDSSAIEVRAAQEGDRVRPGLVLFAPAGRHLSFIRQQDGDVLAHLDARPLDTPHRPAVDVLFRSAAEVYGPRALGIVMTGMGSDGLAGAAAIRQQGGRIFTEAEDSCVIFGMPRAVLEAGHSDKSVPLNQMSQSILDAIYL